MQAFYCSENVGRVGPRSIKASQDCSECIGAFSSQLLSDWDGYLKTNHPGFSSFTNTVMMRGDGLRPLPIEII